MNKYCLRTLQVSANLQYILKEMKSSVIEVAMSTKEKAKERQEAGNLQTVLNTNHSLRDGK
jgi:hypothetical protein